MTSPARRSWRYSRFTGTGEDFDFDANDVMASLSDDLAYHGDLTAALRRLLQEGFSSREGAHFEGLQQILERIRRKKEELASRTNEFEAHVKEELDQILSTERQSNDEALAKDGPTREKALERHSELDLLGHDLVDQVRGLMSYDFSSKEAEQRFDELVDELRSELVQSQLDAAAGAMASASPEERQHLRDGLDALNAMLEQRARGEALDPSFEEFMSNYGDLSPGDPKNLDELLENLARRMAAASAMAAAMTPDQQRQLEALSSELMSDMDLAWQLDRLGGNLRDSLPQMSWDEALGTPGDPLSVLGSSDAISEISELSELAEMLNSARDGSSLHEVDTDAVERMLGKDAARSIKALGELTKRLEEAGLVAKKGGRLVLSPQGLRRLGQNALTEMFKRLRKDRFGDHPVGESGIGHDRDVSTKPYEFGDPFRLDLERTLRNAISRLAVEQDDEQSAGVAVRFPIGLVADDFEIERTEQLSAASTVLAIDLSLSMPMRDNFLAAKKVALALQSLIGSRYPRDYLGLVGFSATAREIRPEELPEVSWDFAYGTNLQHALALSRKMLAGRPGAKQVIVVTDGEPTAHILEGGGVFFNYPAVPETIEATLQEVLRCTREHIVINTFVLDETGGLRSFVARMTKMNRGRAFQTTPQSLGDYLLVDFVEHRSSGRARRVRRGA